MAITAIMGIALPQLLMSLLLPGATSYGLSSRIVIFASLPGSRDPTDYSSRIEYAASGVTALSATCATMLSPGPATGPENAFRLTADPMR
jgi:hypothetical protein